MKKCPYCYEDLISIPQNDRCPFCSSPLGGEVVNLDFPAVDRKKCVYCGESVAKEARYCRYCHKWIEDVEKMVKQLEELENEEKGG